MNRTINILEKETDNRFKIVCKSCGRDTVEFKKDSYISEICGSGASLELKCFDCSVTHVIHW